MVNYEDFDYEKYSEEILLETKKPNILLCGASQIGKSSLINDILELSDEKKAEVGGEGHAVLNGIRAYESDTVRIYDTEGYEVGSDKMKYFEENVLGFIAKKRRENYDDISQQIHEVWYCISAGNERIHDIDKKVIDYAVENKLPVCLILTKVDMVSVEKIEQWKKVIKEECSEIAVFTYSTVLEKDSEAYNIYVQKNEIIKWALENLNTSLRAGLLNSVKGGLEEKWKYVNKAVVIGYSAKAVAAVIATNAVVNAPFSDSVVLMGLQSHMVMKIFQVYGLNSSVKDIVGKVVGTSLLSHIGKTAASQIVGILPMVGNAAKVVVNTSIAATVTMTVGWAVSYITKKYLEECVDRNGKANIPFTDWFTKEKLAEGIRWVEENASTLKLTEEAEKIVEEVKRAQEKEGQ